MGAVNQAASSEGNMISVACKATAFPCTTAFGHGSCCSFEGPTLWKKHTDVLYNLQKVGEQVVSGSVASAGTIMTMVPPEGGVLTIAESFMSPFYVPNSCMNNNDNMELSVQMSTQCLQSQIPGIKILNCGLQWS